MTRFNQIFRAALLASLVAWPGLAEEREGGISGTGISGVGIAGRVTQLGSIYVNGQHIRFDPGLAVRDAVLMTHASEILPGHTVAVVAVPEGDGWRAQSIRQVVPLLGPVDEIGDGWLRVMGTRVAAPGLTSGILPGQWIAVSGLWREAEVVASRLDPLPADAFPARIMGSAFVVPGQDGLSIGGSRVEGIAPQHLAQGELALVTGQPTASGLQAERFEIGLFDAGVGVVQAEGYLSPPLRSGLYTLLGSGLVAYTDQPEMIDGQAHSLRCGQAGQLATGTEAADQTHGDLWQKLGCE